mgnify:CR=1 FL=1
MGKIYAAIDWDDLVATFNITEQKKGRNYLFSPKGRLGLMFLKHYANCSDRKMIEQLNSNLDYQFFCDIELGFERFIKQDMLLPKANTSSCSSNNEGASLPCSPPKKALSIWL